MITQTTDNSARYLLEENEIEIKLLYQQHDDLRTLAGLFRSPIKEKLQEGILVLDSACGPAAWTSDMSTTYPNSKFVGIDIASSVFPEDGKFPNCEFIVGDVAKSIPFPDNTFDFIHQRLLVLALSSENWDKALKELYRVLKPGGYIEAAEINVHDMRQKGPLLKAIQDTISVQLVQKGMAPDIAVQLKDRLEATGFTNIEYTVHKLAVKSSDPVGRNNWDNYSHFFRNLRPVVALSNPEWEDEAIYENYIEDCGNESEELTLLLGFTFIELKSLSIEGKVYLSSLIKIIFAKFLAIIL